MGDRGNIVFIGGDQFPHPVVLYSHWGGSELAQEVAKVLAFQARWDNHAYLARRIASYVWGGAQGKEETGSGLTAGPLCDNDHPIIVIDFESQSVAIVDEDEYDHEKVTPLWAALGHARWSFKQIVKDPKAFLQAFHCE